MTFDAEERERAQAIMDTAVAYQNAMISDRQQRDMLIREALRAHVDVTAFAERLHLSRQQVYAIAKRVKL